MKVIVEVEISASRVESAWPGESKYSSILYCLRTSRGAEPAVDDEVTAMAEEILPRFRHQDNPLTTMDGQSKGLMKPCKTPISTTIKSCLPHLPHALRPPQSSISQLLVLVLLRNGQEPLSGQRSLGVLD